MRNLVYLGFLFIYTTQAQVQTPMTTAEATDLKTKVKALAASTQTISSDFEQYKHLSFLDNDIETSGKLAYKAPNLIKWAYLEPFYYTVIFKDDKLYINDEGKKSDIDIGKNRIFKQLNKLIISSVKGDMFDDSEFSMAYFKTANNSLVYFTPKIEKFGKYIESFQITFNEAGDVIEVKMVEPSKDYTRILFKNKVLNQTLDDSVFTH